MFPTLPNCPGGGGGVPLIPSRISVVLVEETNAGTLHDRSVHVMISHWPARTGRLVGLCLRATLGRHTRGGGGGRTAGGGGGAPSGGCYGYTNSVC